MANKGRSVPGLFGGYTHYDEHGNKTGYSEPSFFGGGYNDYDAKGNRIGSTEPNFFGGGYTHYDSKGRKIGTTEPGILGDYVHRDAKGKRTGVSDPGIYGSYNHHDSACYIATSVYGSYDCPQVWTLRRFRDMRLAGSAPGRAFIKAYYSISPGLVAKFGDKQWFVSFWRRVLDKGVEQLKNAGFEDTPYTDR